MTAKMYYFPFLFIFTFLIGSCIEHDDLGYPKNIYFGREGGVQYISGEDLNLVTISIRDFDGNEDYVNIDTFILDEETGKWEDKSDEMDNVSVSYQWRTVEVEPGDNRMKLTARPLESNKKRFLYIVLYTGYSEGTLKVTQR